MSDLSMTRGNTALFDSVVRYLPSSGVTGYSAWFTVKRDAADSDAGAVVQKTLAGGGITASGPSADSGVYAGYYFATLTTEIDPPDTQSLPAGMASRLVWDLKIKNPNGKETTVDGGALIVAADVTQAT